MTVDMGTDKGASRALSPSRVDLWIARLGLPGETALLDNYRSLLTPEEREQETHFHFEADRRRYLVTRVLVRTTLSLYAACRPADWRFRPTRYGRPEIVRGGEGRPISFNLSHTNGMIVLAVTGGPAIGVDVENMAVRSPPLEIADRFFAPQELFHLKLLPPEAKAFRFWEYWTLKESYTKARGMGLSIPLDSFYFSFEGERSVVLHGLSTFDDNPTRWNLWQLILGESFLAALCVEDAGEPPEICPFEVVPLVSSVALPFNVWRNSRPAPR